MLKRNLTNGFTIIWGKRPHIKVPGPLCLNICEMQEVKEFRARYGDAGLSTKIVDIILKHGSFGYMKKEEIEQIREMRKVEAQLIKDEQVESSSLIKTVANEIAVELRKHYNMSTVGPWIGEKERPEAIIEKCLGKLFPHQANLPSKEEMDRRVAGANKALSVFGSPRFAKKKVVKAKEFKPKFTGVSGLRSPDGREFL